VLSTDIANQGPFDCLLLMWPPCINVIATPLYPQLSKRIFFDVCSACMEVSAMDDKLNFTCNWYMCRLLMITVTFILYVSAYYIIILKQLRIVHYNIQDVRSIDRSHARFKGISFS